MALSISSLPFLDIYHAQTWRERGKLCFSSADQVGYAELNISLGPTGSSTRKTRDFVLVELINLAHGTYLCSVNTDMRLCRKKIKRLELQA